MFFPEKLKKSEKIISIFGSTGSIGCNCLKLISAHKEKFKVKILAAAENVELLSKQAAEFLPEFVIIENESKAEFLKEKLKNHQIKILSGKKAMLELAKESCDIHIAAISGIAGLPTTITALEAGNNVAIANKESLVCAGEILNQIAARKQINILPIDSEHSAIFQLLDFSKISQLQKITLTASGGPFLRKTIEQIKQVKIEEALKHPNWSMGFKNSIDSATMANKGLEVIEAFHLFKLSMNQIEILIHPESIIHGLISYKDGSHLAQAGSHTMLTPISYALSWPERLSNNFPESAFDLGEIGSLTFEKPNEEKFPFIRLTREVLNEGGIAPLVMNSANEEAVLNFKNGKIKFHEIAENVEKTLSKFNFSKFPRNPEIDLIFQIDKEARLILS